MAHPPMFDDDDPFLERIRGLAGELPNTDEKVSHGRPAFFTKKVFAYYGGSLKVDGEWVQHPQSVIVQPDESDRRALLDDDRTFVPAPDRQQQRHPTMQQRVRDLDRHTLTFARRSNERCQIEVVYPHWTNTAGGPCQSSTLPESHT